MRTKTILLSAACGLVAAAAANADSVYSVNVVGYVNKHFKANDCIMFSNPLNTTNTLSSLFSQLTDADAGTTIYAWNPTISDYDILTYVAGLGWYDLQNSVDANGVLFAPGKGGWYYSQNEITITFVGDVLTGSQPLSVPAGWSQIGSKIPIGSSQTLVQQGLVGVPGDNIFKWAGTDWVNWTFVDGLGWYNLTTSEVGDPVIDVAEGIWYQTSGAFTWSRTFTVN